MNTGEIILLVLGVIIIVLAVKGKPLWNNWGKPLWSFLKQFNAKHPDVKIWVLIFGGIGMWGGVDWLITNMDVVIGIVAIGLLILISSIKS